MYKTMVVKYSPKSKEMAAKIEETANKMEQEGSKASWYLESPENRSRKSESFPL